MSYVAADAIPELLAELEGKPCVEQWLNLFYGIAKSMRFVNLTLRASDGLINFWTPPPELMIDDKEIRNPQLFINILGMSLAVCDFARTESPLLDFAVASNLRSMHSLPVLYWFYASLATAEKAGVEPQDFTQDKIVNIERVRSWMQKMLWSTAHETHATLMSSTPTPMAQIYDTNGDIMPCIAYMDTHRLSTVIQAGVRGWSARKRVRKIRTTMASISIQAGARGWLARCRLAQLLTRRNLASASIQSLARRWLAHRRLAQLLIQRYLASTSIQSSVRGWLARRVPVETTPEPTPEPTPTATPEPSTGGTTALPNMALGTGEKKTKKRKKRKKAKKAKAEEDIDDILASFTTAGPIEVEAPTHVAARLDPDVELSLSQSLMRPQIVRSLDLLEHPGIQLGGSVHLAVVFMHALATVVDITNPLFIRVHPFTGELMKQFSGIRDRSMVISYNAASIALKIFALAAPSYETMVDVFASRIACHAILKSLKYLSGDMDTYDDIELPMKWAEGHHVLEPIITAINSLPFEKRDDHNPVMLSDVRHPDGALVPLIANFKTIMAPRYLKRVTRALEFYNEEFKEDFVPVMLMVPFRGTNLVHKSRSLDMLVESDSVVMGRPSTLLRDFRMSVNSQIKSSLKGRISTITLLVTRETELLLRQWYGYFDSSKANAFVADQLPRCVQLGKMLRPSTMQSRAVVVQALSKRMLPKVQQFNLGRLDSNPDAAGFSVACPTRPFLNDCLDLVLSAAAPASSSCMSAESLYAARLIFGTVATSSVAPLWLMLQVIVNIMGTAIITSSDAPYGPNLIAVSNYKHANRMAMLTGHLSNCPFDLKSLEDALFIGITDNFVPGKDSKTPAAIMASNSLELLYRTSRERCGGRMMVLCTLLGDSTKLEELSTYSDSLNALD